MSDKKPNNGEAGKKMATAPLPSLKDPVKPASLQDRILKLVRGEEAAPNEMIQYLVNKYREARAQFDQTDNEVRALQERLENAKAQRLILQGGTNKYLEDLTVWLGKEQAPKGASAAVLPGLPGPEPKPLAQA